MDRTVTPQRSPEINVPSVDAFNDKKPSCPPRGWGVEGGNELSFNLLFFSMCCVIKKAVDGVALQAGGDFTWARAVLVYALLQGHGTTLGCFVLF